MRYFYDLKNQWSVSSLMVRLQALLCFPDNVFRYWVPFKLQSSLKYLEIPCVLAAVFFGSGQSILRCIYMYQFIIIANSYFATELL